MDSLALVTGVNTLWDAICDRNGRIEARSITRESITSSTDFECAVLTPACFPRARRFVTLSSADTLSRGRYWESIGADRT